MSLFILGEAASPRFASVMRLRMLAQVVDAGSLFTCTPTAVWDGDGPVWCAEGPKIRLAGIAAREMDGSCRNGHPCPAASATQARDQLVRLLGGPRGQLPSGHIKVSARAMKCLSDGNARGDRTAAWCRLSDGTDLNCAMVRSGVAAHWDRYWRNHGC
jgi:endonuclease YncB( thermonuclease family)